MASEILSEQEAVACADDRYPDDGTLVTSSVLRLLRSHEAMRARLAATTDALREAMLNGAIVLARVDAAEARLAEVEAERDRAWRECSKAQDESSVWFNKRAAAEGRAAKERSGRLAAEARLAEVEQALRTLEAIAGNVVLVDDEADLLVPYWRAVVDVLREAIDVLRAVLDKGEQG